ncbi:MAG: glutathione S-transferase family protein, partial [Gammaproteobacteria bacterium]|nr:glutathione S-transferase family protein [Gammaproteobacteria bacterium]
MELELIGFDLCPYVHRTRITVLHKNIACKVTHIDRTKPPEWFRTLAPSGKVPLLRVNDNTVIFESAVINEYLDEISGGGLMPADPLRRALSRGWIEYASGLWSDLKGFMNAKSPVHFDAAVTALRAKYAWIERTLDDTGPYFDADSLSLVDFAYAPLFVRIQQLGANPLLHVNEPFPKLKRWSNAVQEISAVNTSLGENFRAVAETAGHYSVAEQLKIPLALRREGVTLFHAPHYVLPPLV